MNKFSKKRGKYLLVQCLIYAILFLLLICWELGPSTLITSQNSESIKHSTSNLRKPLSTKDIPLDDPLLGPPTYENISGKWRIIFHIIGIFYMFAALSIVVDEYFCSALNLMVDTWKIKEDVAGATFMAAGGSAPELFTSIMGVFISKSDVGFGTIIGSAVFNVLFVIGLCAVFAKEVLQLTWWPLFRDCTYYIFGLCTLALFVVDEQVEWWEALFLFCEYIIYCIIMYHNEHLEIKVKCIIDHYRRGAQVHIDNGAGGAGTTNPLAENGNDKDKEGGSDRESSKSVDRQSSMGCSSSTIHLSDSPPEQVHPYSPNSARSGSQETKEMSFRRIAREKRRRSTVCFALEVRSETIKAIRRGSYGGDAQQKLDAKLTELKGIQDQNERAELVDQIADLAQQSVSLGKTSSQLALAATGPDAAAGVVQRPPEKSVEDPDKDDDKQNKGKEAEDKVSHAGSEKNLLAAAEEENDDGNPFELPEGNKERIMFFVTLPLVAVLHFTVPNCSVPKYEKFFMFTFGISLIWIAIFSYLLVWWVTIVGEVIGVSEIVMGLTIIAAGTSIPDALSSVIMARLGQGDMAVSSSIGSNVFDILVGLPVPWFIYTAMAFPGQNIVVNSPYLVLHTLLLLFMVFAVVVSIMLRKWRLDMKLGAIMGSLYFVFLIIALYLEIQQPQSLVLG